MRTLLILGTAAVLSFVATGCGGNKAKAEQLAQQMIDEMNKIADGFEKGDKAALKASFAKLADLGRQAKDAKVTKGQNKAIEDKFKPQMEAAQKRMTEAIPKALAGGKLTPAEIMELGQEMQTLGKTMQNSGD